MNLFLVLTTAIFLFFFVLIGTWYNLTYYYIPPCQRRVFEKWAKSRGLGLACTVSRYVDPRTQLAWEAFKCGLRTPR